MKTDFLPLDLYATSLKNINGIKFTRREMEIIAFLTSGRAVKAIASFLSISPKTVETHIHNTMLKLGCHSRESIINFIEKSDKHFCVRKYYLNLLTSFFFDDCLIKVSKLNLEESSPCLIVFWKEEKKFPPLIHEIMVHLKKAGFKVSLKQLNSPELIETLLSENHSNKSVIYYLSKNWINSYGGDIKTLRSRKDLMTSPSKVCFLLSGEGAKELLSTLKNSANFIDLSEQENYYFTFFEILKRLHPHINLKPIIEAFKENYNVAYPYPAESTSQPLSFKEENDPLPRFYSNTSLIKKKWALVGAFFFIVVFSFSILLFQYITQKEKTTFIRNKDDQQQKNFVRSNLVLPMESIFLDRTELMDQIHSLLEKKEDIQSIALVGAGGSGKTTLARQYAQQSKDEIVWEINAETQESLAFSFEKLAEKLAKTEQERQSLNEFQEIKDVSKKRENILNFVTAHLKKRNHWLLIFDNVETLSEFQNLIPHDSNTWGQGKIIVTTRNSNIQNYKYVKGTIRVGELTPKEKLNLFSKIMSSNSGTFLPSENEEIITFLKNIPSFPLDVSLAACYLKATNSSYHAYLEKMKENNKNFEEMQKELLKELGDYSRTRYFIISNSLNDLIKNNDDFADLLFFISLIDSQNIPRDLLDKYKDKSVVDRFVYYLKFYSLITPSNVTPLSSSSDLYIHRNTQTVALQYVSDTFLPSKKTRLIERAQNILESYLDDIVKEEKFSQLNTLKIHYEVFLSHDNLLSPTIKASMLGGLGEIFYYFGDYKRANKLLQESLEALSSEKDTINKAKRLIYLGTVSKELGDYKKAKTLIDEGMSLYEKSSSKDDPFVAWGLLNLANIYKESGEFDKAIKVLQKSINIYNKEENNNKVKLSWSLVYLGEIYRMLGKYQEAKNLCEKGLEIYKNTVGKDHVKTGWTLIYLGNTYGNLGQYVEAEKALEEAIKIYKVYYSEDNIELAWGLAYLGNIYILTGKYELAKNILDQAYNIHVRNYGENNVRTAWSAVFLANSLAKLGHYVEAKAILDKHLTLHKDHFGENHIRYGMFLKNIGNVSTHLESYKEAKEFLEQALLIYEKHYGKNHTETAQVIGSLGLNYLLEGNIKMADQLLNQALDVFERNKHPDKYSILETLADLNLRKSNDLKNNKDEELSISFKERAVSQLKEAAEIVKMNFPSSSSHLFRISNKLKSLE